MIQDDNPLSYRALNEMANRVANLLAARGVRPGERVALACPNRPEFPAIYYGILKSGAVVVPLNILLKSAEFDYYLADSAAVALFCFEGSSGLPLGRKRCGRRRRRSSAARCLSSAIGCRSRGAFQRGNSRTGYRIRFGDDARKRHRGGVVYQRHHRPRQRGGVDSRQSGAQRFGIGAAVRRFGDGPDRHLVTLPLFHTFGSTVQMNAGFAAAATLVLVERFDAAQAIALMQRHGITFFAGVPTMYWALLNALDEHTDIERLRSTLRMAVSGGASLPVQILEDFSRRFGVNILEGYGLSETSPVATFNHPHRVTKPGSIGQPIWGVEVRLLDATGQPVDGTDQVGEIAVRGYNIMKGYLNRPEATAEVLENGWFRTGDLARRDADGFYFIVDRAKDMIIRGGFNVYPREIEEALIRHPAVSLVAVIGVEHPSLGEEIKAVVVLKETEEPIEEETLIAWSRERLAAYKYPRIVEFVERLPMTSTGKVLKRCLR